MKVIGDNMKKFIVEKEFWDLFPDSAIGILVLEDVKENINISDKEAEEIKNLLENANKEASKYGGFDTTESKQPSNVLTSVQLIVTR